MSEQSDPMNNSPSYDPSLMTGDIVVDPLENQHEVMAKVLPMFELGDEAFKLAVSEFVNKRVNELSVDAETKYVGYTGGGTEKFIGPHTPMMLSPLLTREYYLDDNAAYVASFEYVRQTYRKFLARHPENPDKAYINAVLQGANLGQATYFESWYSTNLGARLDVSADIVSEEVPEVSVADFKRIAACQERAGVAHNTLKIFGLSSRFEAGSVSVQNEEGGVYSEEHAFVSVKNIDGSKVIFDPTNPKYIKNKEGDIVNATASLYKMEDASASAFTGNLTESTRTDDGTNETRNREVTFTFRN